MRKLTKVWRIACGVAPSRPAASTAGSQNRRRQLRGRSGSPQGLAKTRDRLPCAVVLCGLSSRRAVPPARDG